MAQSFIRYSDIEDAFLFVSSGMLGEQSAYISLEDGQCYWLSDAADFDTLPDDLEGSEAYVAIPHKNELDLGQTLVHEFVANHGPQIAGGVRDIFGRRGAYSRYKSLLHDCRLLDAWYQFENERTEQALREWCAEEGIRLADEEAG